jgi:hypothetical protein
MKLGNMRKVVYHGWRQPEKCVCPDAGEEKLANGFGLHLAFSRSCFEAI